MSLQTLINSIQNESSNYNKLDDLTLLSYKFELDKSFDNLEQLLEFKNTLLEIKSNQNLNQYANFYLSKSLNISLETYNNQSIPYELDNNIKYSSIACESLITDIQDKLVNFKDIILGSYKNTSEILNSILSKPEEFKEKLLNPECKDKVLNRINIYNNVVKSLNPIFCIDEDSLEGFISTALTRLKFYDEAKKQYGPQLDKILEKLTKGIESFKIGTFVTAGIITLIFSSIIWLLVIGLYARSKDKKDIKNTINNMNRNLEIQEDEFSRIYSSLMEKIEEIHISNNKNININPDTTILNLKELKQYLKTVNEKSSLLSPSLSRVISILKNIEQGDYQKYGELGNKAQLLQKAILFYSNSARAQNELIYQFGMLLKEINKI